MKIKYRNIIIEATSLLYICVFIYAALSKLLDFENFRIQLGQSPMLSSFAGVISWAVPIGELIISVLLALPLTRPFGLLSAYTLMTMFTAYIFIMLNYSAFIPCSCGGVLEKMTWDQHLLFNIAFMALAIAAVVLLPARGEHQHKIIV
ncbi:MauE/DoxX family redox-associated membrane protein [Flavobacterium sp.]|uniref:MauE/DoxX family redox-associated membrane protein n=1 Tax=Flavobacterium sp. TaxID=239 RepID=UPI004033CB2C